MPPTRPKVATIPAGVGFVDALAAGILDAHGGADPMALTEVTVLVPTRRAVRGLSEAFLRRSGAGTMLLPAIRAIGDVDDDDLALAGDGEAEADSLLDDGLAPPVAISGLRRQLLLAVQIRTRWTAEEKAGRRSGGGIDQAARLAGELAGLIDRVQTAQLDFGALAKLVPADYAAHWQETLEFLGIVTDHWPQVLAERGLIDPAERRNRMMAALARRWRAAPPAAPIIAAGSTGSIPATAALLAVVAGLPEGMVVLPGLDRVADAESWTALGESHPQYGLKLLLERLDLDRAEVTDWPHGMGSAAGSARERLISEVMRPEATTEAWGRPSAFDRTALENLEVIECPDTQSEAGVIALLMRETVETEDRTAALVTSDRDLARRVAAALRRWDIAIDDSAGQPLAETALGSFLRLIAAVAAEGAAPVPLLGLLKHPLSAGGLTPGAFRAYARALELACLRGPRAGGGLAGLRTLLREGQGSAAVIAWLDRLVAALAPLAALLDKESGPLADMVQAHLAAAEWLAADDTAPGTERLWTGEAGRAGAAFFADLGESADVLAGVDGRQYPALLDSLMAGRPVRPRFGTHPRLNIWGPLEARLQHADRVILGGLNESSWPRPARADPWMSRPMQSRFGLPLPERMIGLAAHDFAQLFCAPEVVLTRSTKVEGTPTVPSRWLVRLETVLQGAGIAWQDIDNSGHWTEWQDLLDRPAGGPAPIARPAPRPPLAARPRRLSVTRIERWMGDPYEIFARHILDLRPLDPIDADPGAADYGSFVHQALDRFVDEFPRDLPDDAEARLMAIGREAFGPALHRHGVWAFWWPRFARIARWFLAREHARRPGLVDSATERDGVLDIAAPGGDFRLTARVDRIDRRPDGAIEIVDYKTGAPPADRRVQAGFAPQLPLEAAIAVAGGFENLAAAPVSALSYWRLSGGDPAGKVQAVKGEPATLAADALDGLRALVAAFDDPATPYRAQPVPEMAPTHGDYLHLARVREWSLTGGEDGE